MKQRASCARQKRSRPELSQPTTDSNWLAHTKKSQPRKPFSLSSSFSGTRVSRLSDLCPMDRASLGHGTANASVREPALPQLRRRRIASVQCDGSPSDSLGKGRPPAEY